MELISLLPFFIFLLFVILTIYRTKQRVKNLGKPKKKFANPLKVILKSKESEKEEKKTGWKNILLEAYEQLQREIKKAQEQKRAKYEIPEKVAEQSKPVSILREKEPLIPSPPPIPVFKDTQKKKMVPPPSKPESASVQETKALKTAIPMIEQPTIHDLQKAIIWAEILAPPLALREKEDPF